MREHRKIKKVNIFLVSIVPLLLIKKSFICPKGKYDPPISFTKPMSLYIAILCLKNGCRRGFDLYNSWANDFLDQYKFSTIEFFSPGQPNLKFNKYTETPLNSGSYRILFLSNIVSVKKFLEETQYEWMLRTTYDVYINSTNLEQIVSQLSKQYDTNKDYVLKGHVIPFRNKIYYIHGGSGWILSRKAAQMYLNKSQYLFEKSRSQPDTGDDVMITQIAKMMNLTIDDIEVNRFIGLPITNETAEMFIKGTANRNIENCPDNSEFFNKTIPISKVAIWHSGRPDNFAVRYGKNVIANSDPNLHLLHDASKLCIKK